METMPRPRAALMQPTFLPWLGYFALMRAADVFVVLDDFQFVRRSFHQRNRLFLGKDRFDWVTVPVEHRGDQEVTLASVAPRLKEFRGKLLGSLRHAYAGTAHLRALLPEIERWIGAEHASLAELNVGFLRMCAAWLGIETPLVSSASLGSDGTRSARIADLLRRAGARTYLSARGAAGYMIDEAVFPLPDVVTVFQAYEPAPYRQAQATTFVPYLSALDAVLQLGPDGARAALEAGERPFVSWGEVVAQQDRQIAVTGAPDAEDLVDTR
jgi:hypothetical protein